LPCVAPSFDVSPNRASPRPPLQLPQEGSPLSSMALTETSETL
jgi:hypothetical protein